jgi:hypothetical protein
MPRYLLSVHSFLCIAEDHAVFLDLKHDKYTAIAPEEAFVLQDLVRGWPKSREGGGVSQEVETHAERLARTLVGEGLLTENPRVGKPATPVSLDTPTATFWWNGPWPQLERHHLVSFLKAWLTVTVQLRCFPLRRIVQRVHRRKARILQSPTPFDAAYAHRLTTIYLILQPTFFSGSNQCLRNSLTLLEFLARYGLYPTWAFGVRMNPWGAHSWVQEGPIVLNDTIESVRGYTPILTI